MFSLHFFHWNSVSIAVPCRNGLADSRSTGNVQQPLNSIDQCFSICFLFLTSSYFPQNCPLPSSTVSVLVSLCSVCSLCSEKMPEKVQTGGAFPQADFVFLCESLQIFENSFLHTMEAGEAGRFTTKRRFALCSRHLNQSAARIVRKLRRNKAKSLSPPRSLPSSC